MTWQSRADVYVLPTCFGFLTSFYYALPVVSSLVAFTAAACAAAAATKFFCRSVVSELVLIQGQSDALKKRSSRSSARINVEKKEIRE